MQSLAVALARAAMDDVTVRLLMSTGYEEREGLPRDLDVTFIPTFASGAGALLSFPALCAACVSLATMIKRYDVDLVVDLMPHVWSRALIPVARRAGARTIGVIHDASPHPGDATAMVLSLVNAGARTCDHVITLSEAVAHAAQARWPALAPRLTPLFHPHLAYGAAPPPPAPGAPLRLLFMGRILPYKGLGLFLRTCEDLQRRGIGWTASVLGEGDISGADKAAIEALNITLANRWLSNAEIASALASHHVVVASHLEASQSGVIAAAHGAGLPVAATPVGALPEQVQDGLGGAVATAMTSQALADAIERIRAHYPQIQASIARMRDARTPERFLQRLLDITAAT
jgi:glycosyltransferase involved in cell wall biosynthesis